MVSFIGAAVVTLLAALAAHRRGRGAEARLVALACSAHQEESRLLVTPALAGPGPDPAPAPGRVERGQVPTRWTGELLVRLIRLHYSTALHAESPTAFRAS